MWIDERIDPRSFKKLQHAIPLKNLIVGVVGLGYVGLPLAVEFAKRGFKVIGFDTDGEKIKKIRKGESYIADVPSDDLKGVVREKIFNAELSFEKIQNLSAIIICVPTPLVKTKDPDLSYVIFAGKEIKKWLQKGQLIILESTTYPGTTEEVLLPILSKKGLKVGQEFFLAFSPERVDPGNKKYGIKNTPKIVGGVTPYCTELASDLYREVVDDVIPVSSPKVAEMVKLLENTFRSVNIALVNEIALMSDKLGINVWEVIEAASTKPFGFMPFRPGPGIGGHCIPVDPHYLSWKARQNGFEARFIDLAGKINGLMPHHVTNKISDSLNDQGKSVRNSKILIVGLAYKKDIDDIRESPALDVMALLHQKGAILEYHDPYVPTFKLGERSLHSTPISEETLRSCDCLVILTDHSGIKYDQIVKESTLIIDTRNALKKYRQPHIKRL